MKQKNSYETPNTEISVYASKNQDAKKVQFCQKN